MNIISLNRIMWSGDVYPALLFLSDGKEGYYNSCSCRFGCGPEALPEENEERTRHRWFERSSWSVVWK